MREQRSVKQGNSFSAGLVLGLTDAGLVVIEYPPDIDSVTREINTILSIIGI
jgi:hypothetical protein